MAEQNNGLDIDGVVYTQEDYLNFAQARRVKFIQAVESAAGTPEDLARMDPERQGNYLAAIRDLEKQVISLKKLEQDKESTDAQNNMVAEYLIQAAAKREVELRERKPQPTPESRGIMPDPSLLPSRTLIPGETEIGDRIENYREYKIRTGQVNHQDPHDPLASLSEE